MAVFGVVSFIIGVIALAMLVIRRGQKKPTRGLDHFLVFIGTAGVIVGIGVVFMRFT
ncbi:MAG: hypothetical protein AB7E79_15930 [Rhodospirillaceae bacterium]